MPDVREPWTQASPLKESPGGFPHGTLHSAGCAPREAGRAEGPLPSIGLNAARGVISVGVAAYVVDTRCSWISQPDAGQVGVRGLVTRLVVGRAFG